MTTCSNIATPFMTHDLYHGKLPREYGERGHMVIVFDEVRRLAQVGQGTQVMLNRWFQLWQTLRHIFQQWGLFAFVTLGQCLTRGYYSSYEDVGFFTLHEDAEVGPGALVGGEAHGAAPGPGPVRPPRDDIQQLRHKCEHTVHLACEILCSRSARDLLVGLSYIIQPLEIRHHQHIVLM